MTSDVTAALAALPVPAMVASSLSAAVSTPSPLKFLALLQGATQAAAEVPVNADPGPPAAPQAPAPTPLPADVTPQLPIAAAPVPQPIKKTEEPDKPWVSVEVPVAAQPILVVTLPDQKAEPAKTEMAAPPASEPQAKPVEAPAILEGLLVSSKPTQDAEAEPSPVAPAADAAPQAVAKVEERPRHEAPAPQPQTQGQPAMNTPTAVRPASAPEVHAKPVATPSAPGVESAVRIEALERPAIHSGAPLRSISIPVGQEARPIAVVQLLQQAEGVRVMVRSSDPILAKTIETDLPQLVQKLSDAGVQAEFRARESDSPSAPAQRVQMQPLNDAGQFQQPSGEGRPGPDWSAARDGRRSRLWNELLEDERQHAKEGA